MAQIGNLRFPKVFVFDPTTELITDALIDPTELTAGQVGIFNARTNVGAGAVLGATKALVPVIKIAQNLGDNKFGVIQTKNISIDRVRSWRGVKASNQVQQVINLGWDGTSGSLAATVGQYIVIPITIYDREIKKWYGKAGYTVRLVPDPSIYAGIAEGQAIPQLAMAEHIRDVINGDFNADQDWPATTELSNFLSAVVTNNGAGNYGVAITVKAVPIESLNGTPKQFYKPNIRTVEIGKVQGDVYWNVNTTVKANPGNGYPLEVAELEKESQGYNLVRNQFEYSEHMALSNFIIRAEDGVKYDIYYLEYNEGHQNTGLPGETVDPYIAIFAVPAGTGETLQAWFNGWLDEVGIPAVDVTGAEDVRGIGEVENA